MAIRLITVISMTDLNNSNADEERPNAAPNGGEGASSNADDLDAAWAEFASSHADDLQAVEHSRSAKRFEKHAQRREKEALLSIQDLDQGTFTDDTPQGRGPRDFTGSSWLDTDSVMDRYGDDFSSESLHRSCQDIEVGVLGAFDRWCRRYHRICIHACFGWDFGTDFRCVRVDWRCWIDRTAQGTYTNPPRCFR